MKKYLLSCYAPGYSGPVATEIHANKFILDNDYGLVTFIRDDEPVFVFHTTDTFTIERVQESQ